MLSALWMGPFGIGVVLWTQGLPWPRNPPRATWTAMMLELGRIAPRMGVAVAATFLILGGSCGLMRVVVDTVDGLDLRQALLGGAENAAFLLVLCAIVGPVLWVSQAWRAVRS